MKCNNCQTENKESAKFCKKCGNKLELNNNQDVTSSLEAPDKKNNTRYLVIVIASVVIIVFMIYAFINKNTDSNPNSDNNSGDILQYSENINLYNTIESRRKFDIDYNGLNSSSEISFFEDYHIVEEIMAPEIPDVIYEKQETETQTIYRKRITNNLNFVTIVYKNEYPITAHSYLMDNDNNIVLEATNYFILDQSSNDYELAYSSDNTDYNFIYNDSIKKENSNMEYYYLINDGNFTIDYYQNGNFLYSLGFVRDGDVMSKRYQYYNDNKIISFEYENFNDGTNIIYRLDEKDRFRFVRNFQNFTLESQQNLFYYYDNNSLMSHLYNAESNLRINYIYDFNILNFYEIKYTGDWEYRSTNGFDMELKAFNPFYYEKYAELFGIYDVGVYFKSFQFIRYE